MQRAIHRVGAEPVNRVARHRKDRAVGISLGTAWILRGRLTWRSGYLPRFLGALMVAAGLGFVAKTLTQVLAPAWSADLLLAPMFLNAAALVVWMLVWGVDRAKWDRATG